jgi:AraC family transcriptional regulator, alkane utilization regulator
VDVLSDVLDTVRLTSTVFAQAALSDSWGISARPREHFAFHVISRGCCWLEVDGQAPITIAAGDVVVLAPGRGHTVRSALDSPVRDIAELMAEGALCRPVGVGSDTTNLVCGSFNFEGLHGNLLLPLLPVVLHVRESAPDAGPWLAQTLRLLSDESFVGRPGSATVINRLCDALFVYALRSHLATLTAPEANWLRALEEPQIGAALGMIHEQPGAPWSVPTLASRVGMSRSAFAARFTDLVGEPPMRYLTHWRLQKAAAMLRAADIGIDEIAGQLGYDSTVAFSKAFKRSIGIPPGTYRRQTHATAPNALRPTDGRLRVSR